MTATAHVALVVEGKPDQDISAIRNVRLVMIDGEILVNQKHSNAPVCDQKYKKATRTR